MLSMLLQHSQHDVDSLFFRMLLTHSCMLLQDSPAQPGAQQHYRHWRRRKHWPANQGAPARSFSPSCPIIYQDGLPPRNLISDAILLWLICSTNECTAPAVCINDTDAGCTGTQEHKAVHGAAGTAQTGYQTSAPTAGGMAGSMGGVDQGFSGTGAGGVAGEHHGHHHHHHGHHHGHAGGVTGQQ